MSTTENQLGKGKPQGLETKHKKVTAIPTTAQVPDSETRPQVPVPTLVDIQPPKQTEKRKPKEVKDKDKKANRGTYSAIIGYPDGSRDDSYGPDYSV